MSSFDRVLGNEPTDPRILLAKVDAVIASQPDFADYAPTSAAHLKWLGRARSVVAQHDSFAAAMLIAVTGWREDGTRERNLGQVLAGLFQTRASLEDKIPAGADQVFGPGARYDFMKAFREITASAKKALLIVDPYVDGAIFDAYISGVAAGVDVRLLSLSHKTFGQVEPAAEAFVSQHPRPLAIRKAALKQIHDRLVFVDDDVCWVLGQSIKDATNASPTYLAPLSPDVTELKRAWYADIWDGAENVFQT
jgi:hypothetical protein